MGIIAREKRDNYKKSESALMRMPGTTDSFLGR